MHNSVARSGARNRRQTRESATTHVLRPLAVLAAAVSAILFLYAGCAWADYYAVVVGISDYPGSSHDLRYCDDDAIDLYGALLEDADRWSPPRVTLLLDAAATKGAIQTAIDAMARVVRPEDVFLLYFSGHGTAGPDLEPVDEADGRDEYLCTYGSTLQDYVRDDELADWLAGFPAQRIVVGLDSCYAGGQIRTRAGEPLPKSIFTGASPAAGDGFVSDIQRAAQEGIRLQDLGDLEGRVVVLAACADDELSWEFGDPIGHGLFTYYLLEALGGAADEEGDGDGDVAADEAYAYVLPRVVATSDAFGLNQHPQLLHLPTEPVALRSTHGEGTCLSVSTELDHAGWHMMAAPGIPCAGSEPCTVLGDDLAPLEFYAYDPSVGDYASVPPCGAAHIARGRGFWVWNPAPRTEVDLPLELRDNPVAVVLRKGWNQVGNPFPFRVCLGEMQVVRQGVAASVRDAADRGWLSGYFFPYDPAEGLYRAVQGTSGSVEPWEGFWVRALTDCELVMAPSPCPPTPPVGTLSARNADRPPAEYPPPPPGGARLVLGTRKDLPPGAALDDQEGEEEAAPETMRVALLPNPARTDRVTFAVQGVCWCRVRALGVEVYDLAGSKVYVAESDQPSVEWLLSGGDGGAVPNGVYLVFAWVNFDGSIQAMPLQKLVVLR